MKVTLEERYMGCLIGLACGDAIGSTVEFLPRGSFPPVTDMVGGGKFRLAPGEWTDDTSMTICLAESLIACQGFDARDQMARYLHWADTGKPGPKDHAIGIGKTVFQALAHFAKTGDPMAGESTKESRAGNGALMRLAPVVLAFYPDIEKAVFYAIQMTLTTHSALECLETSERLARLLCAILRGQSKQDLYGSFPFLSAIALRDSYEINSSGYAPESLEAAIWSFLVTENFEEAILTAVNFGDDADTTGAICGQLSGAYYGINEIPSGWRSILRESRRLQSISLHMLRRRSSPV